MSELDVQTLDAIVDSALLDSGAPAGWLVAQGVEMARIRTSGKQQAKMPAWSEEEEAALEAMIGQYSLEEIGRQLGRSAHAIKCRMTRRGMRPAIRQPGWITGYQIAKLLGVDSHKLGCWIDVGLLEGERLPFEGRVIRRVRWMALKRWLVQPTSWIYFDARKIRNAGLRSLVLRAQELWGDEWLSVRQAADLRGCTVDQVSNAILHGRLYGYRAVGLDRTRDPKWAFWYVRKSEALTFPILGRSDSAKIRWSPAADAFILRSRASGMTWEGIAARMKMKQKTVWRHFVLDLTGKEG